MATRLVVQIKLGEISMMIMLRDDPVIEVFGSPSDPPSWIEAIDIENAEYQFCDDNGQIFVGELVKPASLSRQPRFRLRPEGPPALANALGLLEKAKALEDNPFFPDLASLRQHLTER